MSIRIRLAIAVAVVLMSTMVLAGVVLVQRTRATLISQVDQTVQDNADRVGDHPPKKSDHGYGINPLPAATSSTYPGLANDQNGPSYRVVAQLRFDADGRPGDSQPCGFEDDPKPYPKHPAIPSDQINRLVDKIVTTPATDDSFDYRMLVQKKPGGDFVITAASLEDVNDAVSHLVRILLLVGGAGLVAATLLCWYVIMRGFRPVDRMVDTAAAIAAGDLSRRVPNADPRTELGRLGGALNEMLGQIEEGVRERSASEDRLRRFIADAAHELRTPLTSLRGYAELYRQGAIPDEAGISKAMGRIESEGGRMARLVDDMLLLARLDQQRSLEMKPFDLVGLVQEAVGDFSVVDPDRPLTTDFVDRAIVRGDRLRLRQVIDNLLANARVHTAAGTPMHVRVSVRQGQAELSIADEGPGIAKEDQARVFERFWRADPARVRSRGGSGLGLAIVASLVHAHNGEVSMASELGKGTTFTVRLPIAPGSAMTGG